MYHLGVYRVGMLTTAGVTASKMVNVIGTLGNVKKYTSTTRTTTKFKATNRISIHLLG